MTVFVAGHGPRALRVVPHQDGPVLRLQLVGELDVATAERLVELVADLVGPAPGQVRLDLADLDFVDLVGLRALVTLDRLVTERGGRLAVTGPRPLARLLLRLCGLAAVDGPGTDPSPGRPVAH